MFRVDEKNSRRLNERTRTNKRTAGKVYPDRRFAHDSIHDEQNRKRHIVSDPAKIWQGLRLGSVAVYVGDKPPRVLPHQDAIIDARQNVRGAAQESNNYSNRDSRDLFFLKTWFLSQSGVENFLK